LPVLVTGAAGFIGSHVCHHLLKRGEAVVGVDNMNDYYDLALKEGRLARLKPHKGFSFHQLDIAEPGALADTLAGQGIVKVVHLAAQAGVRHSLDNPRLYVRSNVVGHLEVLEFCRAAVGFEHLVYASSSSVYGGNRKVPFSETDQVDRPVSLYAATKKADELMSHTYAHLFGLPQTGLRFFTVYGPWAGLTWPTGSSPRRCSRAGRSGSSTTARCGAISPMSTTSCAPLSPCSTSRR